MELQHFNVMFVGGEEAEKKKSDEKKEGETETPKEKETPKKKKKKKVDEATGKEKKDMDKEMGGKKRMEMLEQEVHFLRKLGALNEKLNQQRDLAEAATQVNYKLTRHNEGLKQAMKKKEEQLEEMERKREAEAREKEELKKELALWKGRCLEQRPIDGLLSPVHHSTPVKREMMKMEADSDEEEEEDDEQEKEENDVEEKKEEEDKDEPGGPPVVGQKRRRGRPANQPKKLYVPTSVSMADTIRGFWQSILNTKRAYLNPHEHFGRANICRAALASYAAIYFLFKWNSARKAKVIKAEEALHKKNAPIHQNLLHRA